MSKELKTKKKQILKGITECKQKIEKEKFQLQDWLDELSSLDDDCDDAICSLENAIEVIKRHL